MISPLPTSEDFPYATLPSLFMLDLCKFKFLMLFSHLLALEHMVPLYSSLHLANLYLPFESQLIETPFSALYHESHPYLTPPYPVCSLVQFERLSEVICLICTFPNQL